MIWKQMDSSHEMGVRQDSTLASPPPMSAPGVCATEALGLRMWFLSPTAAEPGLPRWADLQKAGTDADGKIWWDQRAKSRDEVKALETWEPFKTLPSSFVAFAIFHLVLDSKWHEVNWPELTFCKTLDLSWMQIRLHGKGWMLQMSTNPPASTQAGDRTDTAWIWLVPSPGDVCSGL